MFPTCISSNETDFYRERFFYFIFCVSVCPWARVGGQSEGRLGTGTKGRLACWLLILLLEGGSAQFSPFTHTSYVLSLWYRREFVRRLLLSEEILGCVRRIWPCAPVGSVLCRCRMNRERGAARSRLPGVVTGAAASSLQQLAASFLFPLKYTAVFPCVLTNGGSAIATYSTKPVSRSEGVSVAPAWRVSQAESFVRGCALQLGLLANDGILLWRARRSSVRVNSVWRGFAQSACACVEFLWRISSRSVLAAKTAVQFTRFDLVPRDGSIVVPYTYVAGLSTLPAASISRTWYCINLPGFFETEWRRPTDAQHQSALFFHRSPSPYSVPVLLLRRASSQYSHSPGRTMPCSTENATNQRLRLLSRITAKANNHAARHRF